MNDNIIKLNIPKKETKQKTISFLRELISNLEKEGIDPDHCIVMTNWESKIDKATKATKTTESHDIFHSDLSTKEILGLIELVKNHFLEIITR